MTGACHHCGRWIERLGYAVRSELYCHVDCHERAKARVVELPPAEAWVIAAGLILRDGERIPRVLREGA